MIKLYIPLIKDLWFRKMFMADEETMAYNHAWGGTIDFPESCWNDWYQRWLIEPGNKRFYRFLVNDSNEFVGEIAYHLDEKENIYIANIIIYSKYRGKGYGKEGLTLLCQACHENGISLLYDDIAKDNPAINLFLKSGFVEEYRTKEIIMLKKYING
jgi:RimJ/RimL family protein N-acetyltransferase